MEYQINFQPVGRRVQCPAGKSVLEFARNAGGGIAAVCGGEGTCGSCKVKLLTGKASPPTAKEQEIFDVSELAQGWRLACQVYPLSDCTINIPPESMTTVQRLQVEGQEIQAAPDPPVKSFPFELQPPSLDNLKPDADRILTELERASTIDYEVLKNLSGVLRTIGWKGNACLRGKEVISVRPGISRNLGLAVDVGSTKLAAYLVDLNDGRTLAVAGAMNPQIAYGEDIVSRMTGIIREPEEAQKLQKIVIEEINALSERLCLKAGAVKQDINEAVIVGNTAMHHILLGLPVNQLAYSPFVPAVGYALDIKSREIGLEMAKGAYVHLLPNIAGFVGADHVSMLLATRDLWSKQGVAIALDIGTNTEVSIIDHGSIASVSCASGPAFEGGHIKDGMRAGSGAIERVRITEKGVQYETVENAPPAGICGSGVLDTLSQMYLSGIVDSGGRIKQGSPRVRNGTLAEFVLVSEEERQGKPAIVMNQQDIRELQLAKAAMRAGIQVLLENKGRREEDIDLVIIAGAFGSYIDISSAVTIGMLPALPLERFKQVGNAAGMGARLSLVSLAQRAEAKSIASKISYVELATAPLFMQIFVQAGYLGKYRLINGQREELQ